MTEQQMKSISVDDLFNSGKISRKTYNTLVRARMRNVFDLKRYESGLPRLFRSGANGMREISVVLRDLVSSDNIPEMATMLFAAPEPEMSKGEQLLSSLTEEDITLLDIVYRKEIDRLLKSHERTATKVANALGGVPVSIFVRDFLLEDDERLLMLHEVGETSLPQVNAVKESLLAQVDEIRKGELSVPFRILTLQADGLLDDDGFARAYFEEHQHLPVFYIIQKTIFSKLKNQVMLAFLQRYDIFGGQVEIADTKIDKSAFTITTYSNQVYDALFTPGGSTEVLGSFTSELMGNDVNVAYLTEIVGDQLITDDSEEIALIIENEHLVMQPLCVAVILGKLLAHSHVCFGGYPRSFGQSMDERWKHAYLINRSLAEAFDFQRQLWHFRDTVVRTSTDTYALDFELYTAQFLDSNDTADSRVQEEITDILKVMVMRELDLPLDEEGLLMIPRKRDKPLADRLYRILDQKKQPMMLDELTEQINSGDGRRYVRASVSLALNKDERFQGSGKKGCYALRHWELPFFGSNADIVYQVLDQANRPMKSDEIVSIIAAHPYNSQFSKNDLSSVISLGKKMFRKLGLGYYGLTDREYPKEEIQPPKRAFDVELEAMLKFMETHHRIPISSINEEETRLRNWFARKRKDWSGENNWSEGKRQAFSELVAKYDALANVGQPLSMMWDEPTASSTSSPQPEEMIPAEVTNEPAEVTSEPAEVTSEPAEVTSEPEEVTNEPAEVTNEPAEVDEWSIMATEVRCFIEQNKREPLALFTAEVMLADWLTTQKKQLHEHLLSQEQEAELLSLRDLLW